MVFFCDMDPARNSPAFCDKFFVFLKASLIESWSQQWLLKMLGKEFNKAHQKVNKFWGPKEAKLWFLVQSSPVRIEQLYNTCVLLLLSRRDHNSWLVQWLSPGGDVYCGQANFSLDGSSEFSFSLFSCKIHGCARTHLGKKT